MTNRNQGDKLTRHGRYKNTNLTRHFLLSKNFGAAKEREKSGQLKKMIIPCGRFAKL